MIFSALQEFFYLFFREILFVAVGFQLVAGLLLAVISTIRALRDS
jgi:hypothetical protein